MTLVWRTTTTTLVDPALRALTAVAGFEAGIAEGSIPLAYSQGRTSAKRALATTRRQSRCRRRAVRVWSWPRRNDDEALPGPTVVLAIANTPRCVRYTEQLRSV